MESSIRGNPLTVEQMKEKVDEILESPAKDKERLNLPDFLNEINPIFYEFSIWEVPAKRPKGGMVDYKGNCSPYVCAGSLYNYAREGDVVLDPWLAQEPFWTLLKKWRLLKENPHSKKLFAVI